MEDTTYYGVCGCGHVSFGHKFREALLRTSAMCDHHKTR